MVTQQQQDIETFDLNNADWLAIPPTQTSGGGDFVCPDEDMYTMVYEILPEKRKKPPYMGKVIENPPTQVRVRMKIVDPTSEFDGVDWRQWMTISFDERSLMYSLITAIRNGKPFGDGERVDPRDYEGKFFRGMVKVNEFDSNTTGERIRWPRVDSALPLKKRGAATATPVAEPDASEALDAQEAIANAAASGNEPPY